MSAFGLVLRHSVYRGTADYNLVLQLAGQALGQDREGYRKEFLGLVQTAEQLQ